MSDRAPAASAAQTVAAHPPLSVAITTIGVIAVAMVGSTISSQLVDLDIADIGGGFSVSADDASWIASRRDDGGGREHPDRRDPGACAVAAAGSRL